MGKSTLFNAMVGRRVAVTDRAPGTTRDRIELPAEAAPDLVFTLTDTGGLGDDSPGVEEQVQRAVEEAEAVIFLLDAKAGVMPQDEAIARRLRKSGKPVVLAANKCDNERLEAAADEFVGLGLGEPVRLSAIHRNGLDELRKRLEEFAGPFDALRTGAHPAEKPAKVAVVGRNNSGKSTFINSLAGEKRLVVSDSPGTTRDAVDVPVSVGDIRAVIIDTAGFRRRREGGSPAEFFSLSRSVRATDEADAVIFLIDPKVGAGEVEKELARRITAGYKACVLAVNKWDLAEGVSTEDYDRYLDSQLPHLAHAPVVFCSALRGERVIDALRLAVELFGLSRKTFKTSDVNRVLRAAREGHSPPAQPRPGRLYYAAQTGTSPLEFTVFVNDPRLFPETYLRYLASCFRKGLGADELPVRVRTDFFRFWTLC